MSNTMEVKGKRVIVTGAAFGIGKAMTESFLESGAEVVIVDINEEALKQTAGDLNVEYITADVSSEDAIKNITVSYTHLTLPTSDLV